MLNWVEHEKGFITSGPMNVDLVLKNVKNETNS